MNPQILIDAIVRQTTVLIARLSTMEGVRSPLAHVANEGFVGLVRELESQSVGKKVITDMFGLALRSYRQKVQRLGESATTRGVTLWVAIHNYLANRKSTTRDELLERFKYDEEISVCGILNDLIESGIVIRPGKGSGSRSSQKKDEIGGTTLSFDLWPGHPHEAEVRKLLATTRASVIPLWERVTEHNQAQQAEKGYQVHFYCGQTARLQI